MKFLSSTMTLAALTIALAACGSEAAPTRSAVEETAPSLDDAKAVVIDYFTQAFLGKASACEHETTAYAELQNKENDTATCAERVGVFTEMITDGKPLIDITKSVVTVSQGEGGIAVAKVTHELEGSGGTYHLVARDGTWKIDSETDGAENPNGSAEEGASPSTVTKRSVSQAEAKAAARAFCQVKPGVAREKVEQWLGAPSEESTDTDGQIELSWYLNSDSYTVWLNESGSVASYSSSTPREGDSCQG